MFFMAIIEKIKAGIILLLFIVVHYTTTAGGIGSVFSFLTTLPRINSSTFSLVFFTILLQKFSTPVSKESIKLPQKSSNNIQSISDSSYSFKASRYCKILHLVKSNIDCCFKLFLIIIVDDRRCSGSVQMMWTI